MNARPSRLSAALQTAVMSGSLATVICLPAQAEIIFLESGQVASAEAAHAYQHPSFRSVVFVSPEARQMAILPPSPVFIAQPPLLWRAPSAMPAYPPPVMGGGLNVPIRPSNRDVVTYNLQRAHGFSQELYYKDTALRFGAANTSPYMYNYYGSLGLAYPPAIVGGGFNQPVRPSNRDVTTYHLERAHRFSMDAYKKP